QVRLRHPGRCVEVGDVVGVDGGFGQFPQGAFHVGGHGSAVGAAFFRVPFRHPHADRFEELEVVAVGVDGTGVGADGVEPSELGGGFAEPFVEGVFALVDLVAGGARVTQV